jgi:hypothetical protein
MYRQNILVIKLLSGESCLVQQYWSIKHCFWVDRDGELPTLTGLRPTSIVVKIVLHAVIIVHS